MKKIIFSVIHQHDIEMSNICRNI